MHGFFFVGYLFFIALFNLIASMTLCFIFLIFYFIKYNILHFYLTYFILKITKAFSKEDIKESLSNRSILYKNINDDQLGYYLAGLLEGEGVISIPALGNTRLNRILNPR